jgi:2-keto-4-pentenoate hydratase/2-oxohepta-3-ene-1,7-dioic acid hydratase in catechol pathway
MKLLSFIADGIPLFGALKDDGVVTMNERLGFSTLRDALTADATKEMNSIVDKVAPDRKVADIKFLPPIPWPDKILCTGVNYRAHAAEGGREIPKKPSIFLRLPNTLVGHHGEITRPAISRQLDYEGELAVIIGSSGRHISEERALNYVAGYTCFLDGSVRDYQQFSVTSGKNFPNTGPLGPWIVTPDEVPDASSLLLTTRLNGAEVQCASTDLLVHSIQKIIAFCSDFTELVPGDVIATGTPEGVGRSRTPPLWMKAGDVVEVDISSVGCLRATVVNEK